MSLNENKTTIESQNGDLSSAPRLNRVLGLWDLVIYGMILMQLVSPVPKYCFLFAHLFKNHPSCDYQWKGME
jgi:hypothetical protein